MLNSMRHSFSRKISTSCIEDSYRTAPQKTILFLMFLLSNGCTTPQKRAEPATTHEAVKTDITDDSKNLSNNKKDPFEALANSIEETQSIQFENGLRLLFSPKEDERLISLTFQYGAGFNSIENDKRALPFSAFRALFPHENPSKKTNSSTTQIEFTQSEIFQNGVRNQFEIEPDQLTQLMQQEATRISNANITPGQLARLQLELWPDILLNLLTQTNEMLRIELREKIFTGTSYSNSFSRDPNEYNNLEVDDIIEFIESNYNSKNLIISAVGPINWPELVMKISEIWETRPIAQTSEIERNLGTSIRSCRSMTDFFRVRVRSESPSINPVVVFMAPGPERNSIENAISETLLESNTQPTSSRLYASLVNTKIANQLAYHSSGDKNCGDVSISLALEKSKNIPFAERVFRKELHGIRSKPVASKDWTAALQRRKRHWLDTWDQATTRSVFLANIWSSESNLLRWYQTERHLFSNVSPGAISAVHDVLFQPERWSVGVNAGTTN